MWTKFSLADLHNAKLTLVPYTPACSATWIHAQPPMSVKLSGGGHDIHSFVAWRASTASTSPTFCKVTPVCLLHSCMLCTLAHQPNQCFSNFQPRAHQERKRQEDCLDDGQDLQRGRRRGTSWLHSIGLGDGLGPQERSKQLCGHKYMHTWASQSPVRNCASWLTCMEMFCWCVLVLKMRSIRSLACRQESVYTNQATATHQASKLSYTWHPNYCPWCAMQTSVLADIISMQCFRATKENHMMS